jgi:hypothetical protein
MLLYLYRGRCAFGHANAQRKFSKPRFWGNNAEKNFIFLDFSDFERCAFGRAGKWGNCRGASPRLFGIEAALYASHRSSRPAFRR